MERKPGSEKNGFSSIRDLSAAHPNAHLALKLVFWSSLGGFPFSLLSVLSADLSCPLQFLFLLQRASL